MHWRRGSTVLALGLMAVVIAVAGCAQLVGTPSTSTPPAPRVSASASVPAAATSPIATPRDFEADETLKDVHFGPGRSDVLRADAGILDAVIGWLKENPTGFLLIEGHTDDLGTTEQNRTLGEKRATSVMIYLVAKGFDAARITVASYGAAHPVCSEKTEACLAKNRRVRFLVKQD